MDRPNNVVQVYTGIFTHGLSPRRLGLRLLYPGRVLRGIKVVVERHSDHYALEAWERMTTAGFRVTWQ